MGKDTNIMQKIYQLSWFSDKNDFRKYKNICISVCIYGRYAPGEHTTTNFPFSFWT